MDAGNAFKEIGHLEDQIVARVTAVVQGGEVGHVAATLFTVLALALFLIKCTGWALRGFRLDEMVATVTRIMLTGVMLGSFTFIVPAIFNATLYVGYALLAGITGIAQGSPEAVAMPTSLVDVLVKYGFHIAPNCHIGYNPFRILACIQDGAVQVVAALAMSLVLMALCVAIMLVDVWGFWIYGIALAVGPVLVPFTLYERLAFLFEGWLRFFFGVVIYVILARVNLALVAVAILSFWGATPSAIGSFTPPTAPPIDDITNIVGLMLFAGVGGFTLLATGRFSSAVVAGAAAGGVNFGKLMNMVTNTVAPRWVSTLMNGGGSFRSGWRRQRSRQQRKGQRTQQRNGPGRQRNDSGNRDNNRSRVPAVIRVPVGAAFAGLSMGYAAARDRLANRRGRTHFGDTRPDFSDTKPDPDNVDTVPGRDDAGNEAAARRAANAAAMRRVHEAAQRARARSGG